MRRFSSVLVLLTLIGTVAGCEFEFLGPDDVDVAVLEVRVTGGILGVDYTYAISSVGHVTGGVCINGCSFTAGDTLHHLTPAQRQAFVEAVNRSGLPVAGRPVDFGTECCDRLTYRVAFSSGPEIRTFVGGIESFPEPLRVLVRSMNLFFEGVPPVILSSDDGLDGFRSDPVEVAGVSIADDIVSLEVRYAGGCTQHDLDAVAWTGWMESNPVQIGLALTHDAQGDGCKALIQRTLRFDLTPLIQAYIDSYGEGPGTMILQVGPAGGEARAVPFSFGERDPG